MFILHQKLQLVSRILFGAGVVIGMMKIVEITMRLMTLQIANNEKVARNMKSQSNNFLRETTQVS